MAEPAAWRAFSAAIDALVASVTQSPAATLYP